MILVAQGRCPWVVMSIELKEWIMVTYTYLPASVDYAQYRRTVDQEDAIAHRTLGERVAAGWQAVQRYVKTPSGGNVSVTVLLSDDNRVWSIYVSEEWQNA